MLLVRCERRVDKKSPSDEVRQIHISEKDGKEFQGNPKFSSMFHVSAKMDNPDCTEYGTYDGIVELKHNYRVPVFNITSSSTLLNIIRNTVTNNGRYKPCYVQLLSVTCLGTVPIIRLANGDFIPVVDEKKD